MHREVETRVENESSVDRVTEALLEAPELLRRYAVVHETAAFVVYRRVDAS